MKRTVNPFIRYPLYPEPLSRLEKLLIKLGFGALKCLVCGSYTVMHTVKDNLRETCLCNKCGSSNRQRQVAYVLLHAIASKGKTGIYSLKDAATIRDLVVYNTEAGGPIHDYLSKMNRYLCSYYYGDAYKSGEMVGNIMHQDLMDLSFDDQSIDIVLSSDVFEHVAEPYKAHEEVYRVLKSGGRHIFTVPFHQTGFLDDERATTDTNGNTVYLKEPIFHGDPVSLRPEGALVYNIFSLEMLIKLNRIGFRTNLFLLHKPRHGILGPNGIVFEAIKD